MDLENQLEQEQEYVVNKLSAELAKVKTEKALLALEVEREEGKLRAGLKETGGPARSILEECPVRPG